MNTTPDFLTPEANIDRLDLAVNPIVLEGVSIEDAANFFLDLRNEDLWYLEDPGKIKTEHIEGNNFKQTDKSKGVPVVTEATTAIKGLSDGRMLVVLNGKHVLGEKIFGYQFNYILEQVEGGVKVTGEVMFKGAVGFPKVRYLLGRVYKKQLDESFKRLKSKVDSGEIVIDKNQEA